jgi:hypothetical protein
LVLGIIIGLIILHWFNYLILNKYSYFVAIAKFIYFYFFCILGCVSLYLIISGFPSENPVFLGIGLSFWPSIISFFVMKHEKGRPAREWERKEIEEKERVRKEQWKSDQLESEEQRKRERKLEQEIARKKKEVEIISTNYVIDFEKNHFREPEDVSSQNLGYDIKSRNSRETRFIEIKGKGDEGDIFMTSNEWEKAKELENNYYLYVVFHCFQNYHKLYIIINPANKLNAIYYNDSNKYKLNKNEIIENS